MELKRFRTAVKEVEVKKVRKPGVVSKSAKIQDPIYSVCSFGLGDVWSSVNFAAKEAYKKKHRLYLSKWEGNTDLRQKITEVVDVLDLPVDVEVVDERGNMPVHGWNAWHVWGAPYFPTKMRWRGVHTNRYCYQLDGVSTGWAKNPPEGDISKLTSWCGGEFVRLGRHLSIKQCVEEAANSSMFFGVDSGVSHMAHSVGVPMFLIEYNFNFKSWHENKKYTHCKGTDEFIKKAKMFVEEAEKVKEKINRYRV